VGPRGDRAARAGPPLRMVPRARQWTVVALACFSLAALRAGEARSGAAPRTFPRPTAADRLLVIAPHCDDETLATGGLLAQTVAAGGAVRVVLITNGDGFHHAAARLFGSQVSPVDYLQLGLDRQAETRAAMASLGLKTSAISFLGYPDGGTAAMWLSYWDPAHPYTSPQTREDHSPYPNAFTPDAPYAGRSVIADLKRIITDFRPTVIALPHPNDRHPDHWAAYCSTVAALYELDLLGRVRLEHYLVHRGAWPQPRGLHPDLPLLPPLELVSPAVSWRTLPLGAALTERKRRAIGQYRTQVAVMSGFLFAFARADEPFAAMPFPELVRVAPKAIRVDGNDADWQGLPPTIADPREREFGIPASLDLGDTRVAYDGERLLLWVDLRGAPDPQGAYLVHLHPLAPGEVAAPVNFRLRPGDATQGVACALGPHSLEVALPASRAVGPAGVMVAVESLHRGRTADRTAWTLLRFREAVP
jgi:N-acetyl-1-D-myo-inositol-2-amino-2-deoxy-alpha-D-glucopyranoside deacetylase